MADLKKSIEIIFEGNDQASRKAADVLAKVKELEQQTAAASTQGDKLTKSFDGIDKAGAAINAATSAMTAFASALAVKAFIDANVEVEKFEKGIKAVKGASADTTKELEYIRGAAEKYGVELGGLTRSYTSLTAATIGTNLEGDKTRVVFEAVVKAMSATGRSSAETEGALKAIEQIAGKGKVQMEELRGQLGDRLPGALQIAARALGVTTGELENLVKGGLSADDFLPKFAEQLEKTFAGAEFNGYEANLARLRNEIDALFVAAGKAGLFDLLTEAVKGTTNIVDQLGASFSYWGSVYAATQRLLGGGTWEQFGKDIDAAKLKVLEWGAEYNKGVNETLAESNRLAAQAAAAQKNLGDESEAETQRLLSQSKQAATAIGEVDALLKRLGVNPAKVKGEISEVTNALEDLLNNPRTSGAQLLAGFEAALKRVRTSDDLNKIGEALTQAFTDGKISAETFNAAAKLLGETNQKIAKSAGDAGKGVDEQAKAMERAAKEAEKAREKVDAFKLEMEKLASNERIKNIEARVSIDIANLQENTKRIEALFDSIDNTVNSTGDVLKSLFGQISNFGTLDWGARDLIRSQIEGENKRRDAALEIQEKLADAQIDYLRAQAQALAKGDALIKVDGAGLQPHLEGFMWEILRSIQVRVNNDGLQMLLGV